MAASFRWREHKQFAILESTMSEHKPEGTVPAPSEAAAGIGPDAVPAVAAEKPKLPRRVSMQLVGILVFVVIAAGVGLFVYRGAHKPKPENSGTQQKLTAATVSKNQSVEDQAMALSGAGNGPDAQKLLDQALAKATDKAARAKLYWYKSIVATNVGQNQQALEYAQKSESLDPTKNSAQLIAQAEEAAGNKAAALKYYKLELQRMQADLKSAGPGDVQALQGKIKELGG